MSTDKNIESEELETIPRLQMGVEAAAKALDTPQSTLEMLCRRGEGPLFFKVGRRKATTPALIKEWQDEKIAHAKAKALDNSENP